MKTRIDSIDNSYSVTVTTPIFEGPLDLLLQLIERAELDITRLALAQVTDQFIQQIHHLSKNDFRAISVEQVSAFLVIAAKLLQIKSEVLLPKPPELVADEEDVGESLARQLRAYKRYKEIGKLLSERETNNLRTFLRVVTPPKINTIIHLENQSLDELYYYGQKVFNQKDDRLPISEVVKAPTVTIREKISLIAGFIKQNRQGIFRSLFSRGANRVEVVVTFLALLELIKRRLITTKQESLFGEILFEAVDGFDFEVDFEVEFDE